MIYPDVELEIKQPGLFRSLVEAAMFRGPELYQAILDRIAEGIQ